MGGVLAHALSAAYRASLAPSARRFRAAAADPAGAQAARLRALLAANSDTAYGREQGLHRVGSIAQFQEQVPRSDYGTLAPWIERVTQGEPHVLTRAPVLRMERTSGSSGANKLIPHTAPLLEEFNGATSPWIHDLLGTRPGLRGTRSYWSISPAARAPERTPGGIPVGTEDDTEYLGGFSRWAVRRTLAVPPEVARLPDLSAWRDATARHLLAAGDLGLISVWSPTFLTLLMEHITAHLPDLVRDLPAARRREVEAAAARPGGLTGDALWPRLALVSCWEDGPSAHFMPALRRWFPRTPVQGKGLLATEGVVSVPVGACEGAALAVASHFLEFADLDGPPEARPHLAHELRIGGRYTPLLTTGGGLVRYHLKDVVRCVGLWGATPRVRFEGKLDQVSDLCGEKLTPADVAEALRALGAAPRFALLSPALEPRPHYVLHVEADSLTRDGLDRLARGLDAHLRRGHHYGYCRDLGQLGPVRAVAVRDGWARYERALVSRGTPAGAIKPAPLDPHPGWGDVFEEVPLPC